MHVLEPTTDRKIIDFTRLHNSEAWKGKLSVDQYIERDYQLSLADICQPGLQQIARGNSKVEGIVVFVFRDLSLIKSDDDDESTFNIVASVELLIRKSLRYEFDKVANVVKESEVLSGCIGGVFTQAKYRGQKAAFKMINELNSWSAENLGGNGFNFLYSEVGEYYSKCGYKSYPVPVTEIYFRDIKNVPLSSELHITYQKYKSFEPLATQSLSRNREILIRRTREDHKTRLTLTLQSSIFDWFHLRGKLLGNFLHKHTPEVFGISLADSNGTEKGYIVWNYDWSEEHIMVLKIDLFDANENAKLSILKRLLIEVNNYMVQHYSQFNFKSLHIWESELFGALIPETTQKLQRWTSETFVSKSGLSNDSLSALLVFDPSLNNVVWENNCKWCWF